MTILMMTIMMGKLKMTIDNDDLWQWWWWWTIYDDNLRWPFLMMTMTMDNWQWQLTVTIFLNILYAMFGVHSDRRQLRRRWMFDDDYWQWHFLYGMFGVHSDGRQWQWQWTIDHNYWWHFFKNRTQNTEHINVNDDGMNWPVAKWQLTMTMGMLGINPERWWWRLIMTFFFFSYGMFGVNSERWPPPYGQISHFCIFFGPFPYTSLMLLLPWKTNSKSYCNSMYSISTDGVHSLLWWNKSFIYIYVWFGLV